MTSFLCFSFRRPDWRHAAVTQREDRDVEREGKCNGRSQTRYERGKLSKKERERKERRWITHNRQEEERDRVLAKMKRGDGNWLSRFSTCTCHLANWSGEDKDERRVSHIRAFSAGQFMSSSSETSLSTPPSQLCRATWVMQGETLLYPFGGIQNWSSSQAKSKICAMLSGVFFFIIIIHLTHQAFRVMASFQYSMKTEQKTFPKHALRYWFT